MQLLRLIIPEWILVCTACVLFLVGVSSRAAARRAAPWLALLALLGVFVIQLLHVPEPMTEVDPFNAFRISPLTHYIRLLAAGISVMFVLMFWPSDREATGNSALLLGQDAGEFFALMLLSVAGVFIVAGADDMILLFLGLELASIPTYIMVSISRPQAVAQEAGVKYFFLGAMSAALMLFGFSYLYGTTGATSLRAITEQFAATLSGPGSSVRMSPWQMLAMLMLIAGFCFKIAAVPLHVYAADVYQGAATPVTAMLSFIPKISGMVALIKIMFVAGGGNFAVPVTLAKLLWVLAVLTMTVGNVLGLLQFNVKRVLAYSSIAHSGYMLVGLTTLAFAWQAGRPGIVQRVQSQSLSGVLFYLAAYGVMNAAAFGVLMLLPARSPRHHNSTGSAETFEDLAGQGRHHLGLGLAMSVGCFSLIGLPLTVGFFGKLYLIGPAFRGGNHWLVIIMLINAAISAAYYLRIVGTMFLRSEPASTTEVESPPREIRSRPVALAVTLSVLGTLLLGIDLPATHTLIRTVNAAAQVDDAVEMRVGRSPEAALP